MGEGGKKRENVKNKRLFRASMRKILRGSEEGKMCELFEVGIGSCEIFAAPEAGSERAKNAKNPLPTRTFYISRTPAARSRRSDPSADPSAVPMQSRPPLHLATNQQLRDWVRPAAQKSKCSLLMLLRAVRLGPEGARPRGSHGSFGPFDL